MQLGYNKINYQYLMGYGSNYFALAKNYVKNFGLIELSGEQEDKILSLRSDVEINNYVKELYELNL